MKYASNAWLIVYGPVSFPSSGFPAFFTSVDDNMFGESIPGSTSVPNYSAAQAIWMFAHNIQTTVSNIRVRWAQRGIQYDQDPGIFVNPILSSSAFIDCNIGVYVNVSNDTLTLSQDTQCETLDPVHIQSGSVSGSITTDCGVVSVARVNNPDQDVASGDSNKNSQSECSFVLAPNNKIVAAWFSTHLSEYGLGQQNFPGIKSPRSIWWTVSADGGASFDTNNQALTPASPPDPTQGDAGDPVMARDTVNHTIYLLGNPSRENGYQGFRLWKSTDDGQTISLVNTNVPSGFSTGDKPMIAVNNFTNLSNSTNLYAAGTLTPGSGPRGVVVARSSNAGTSWIETTNFGTDIFIRPLLLEAENF